MNIRSTICALLLVSTSLFGTQRVLVCTVPKSGTHLILKYIALLATLYPGLNKPSVGHYIGPGARNITSKSQFRACGNLPEWHDGRNHQKVIFAVRDLRDTIVSFGFTARNPEHPGKGDVWANATLWIYRYPVEERVLMIANGGKYYPHVPRYVTPWLDNIRMNANYLLNLHKAHPNTPIIRFERLVGPEGGGCEIQEQLDEITHFASLLGVTLKQGEAQWLADRLFGKANMPEGTPSNFRKGQVGSWKEYFTPETVEVFKRDFGEFLIHFGYEKDNNWW